MHTFSSGSSRPQFARPISRRRFLIGGGSALAAMGIASHANVFAQNATPAPAQQGAAPAGTPAATLPAMPPELRQYANDWPLPQANLSNHRAAANAVINSSNVKNLEIAWTYQIKTSGAFGAMTCTPIVAGQTVYVQDMESNVYALDRGSGKVIWEKEYSASTEGPNGVALGYGMIYGATGDNRELFALDAKTGKEAWRTRLSGNTRDGIDMAPTVYNGTIYISTVPGNSKAFYEGGARGVLFGVDATNGQILWQFSTTEPDLWGAPSINSGGGSWYPPAIDAQGNLFWDIANPAPFDPTTVNGTSVPNGSTRPGPNLYTDCMVALKPDGSMRWYYEANPHDILDHDLQQSPVLVKVDNNGNPYTALIGSGKLGEVIAVDSATGNKIWMTKVGVHNDWDETQWIPAGQTVTVEPGVAGGVESPIAYADDTIFVSVLNMPTKFSSTGLIAKSVDFASATGELVALDIKDGSVKWDTKLPVGNVSAATVANDVVFAGGLDGLVRAYSTKDGSLLWSFKTAAGLNAPLAVAGDLLIVPSAGPLLTPKNYAPEAKPGTGNISGPSVVAFKLKS